VPNPSGFQVAAELQKSALAICNWETAAACSSPARIRTNGMTADTPIIAMTAFPEDYDADEIKAAGCIGLVAKPVNTRELPEKLRTWRADKRVNP